MLFVENVFLNFPVHLRGQTVTKAQVGGQIYQDGDKTWVSALNDVTCNVDRGERIGIIGRNGSGKSTFLRVCAGIYQPTLGNIHVDGSVGTLFTSSLGMSLYQTGRKNISLGLKLIGLPNRDIEEATAKIAEFSELGEYIDLPLTAYSSGMRTRLGFAIASHVSPDILLIDEVFGAGDMAFAKKAKQRMNEVMTGANTLLLASHSLSILEEFCERVFWFDRGKLVADGPTQEVLSNYRNNDTPRK